MAAEFNIGDTVKLRSGGPEMTVGARTDKGKYECHWFSKEGKVEWHSFKPEMIKIVAEYTG